MDTPCTKEPVQEHLEELHVTKPDPGVLHSRLDDVISEVTKSHPKGDNDINFSID